MTTEEAIMNKIQILITNHFNTPEDAFRFFDDNSDGKLKKSEIVKLLKQAEISGFLRGMVSSKLIDGYDKSGDDLINWQEFQAACVMKDLVHEGNEFLGLGFPIQSIMAQLPSGLAFG